jgi:hypothetical protein
MMTVFSFTVFARADMGLEVGPDDISLEGVLLGEKLSFSKIAGRPIALEIKNKSNRAFDYEINILYSLNTTAGLSYGYSDIPDTGWIIPENKMIKVEAGQTGRLELYMAVPDDASYAGKAYQAVIEVKSMKDNPNDLFVLACQLRVFFTTRALTPVSSGAEPAKQE